MFFVLFLFRLSRKANISILLSFLLRFACMFTHITGLLCFGALSPRFTQLFVMTAADPCVTVMSAPSWVSAQLVLLNPRPSLSLFFHTRSQLWANVNCWSCTTMFSSSSTVGFYGCTLPLLCLDWHRHSCMVAHMQWPLNRAVSFHLVLGSGLTVAAGLRPQSGMCLHGWKRRWR